MAVPVLLVYDATSEHESILPSNIQAAGYDTQAGGGTGIIAWTPEQFARHTNPYPALHIDQDQNAFDSLADLLDVEAGAATENEIVGWLERARDAFHAKTRPDQRWPGIYLSESNLTSAVALLQQAGLTNVPFWIANYGYSAAQAEAAVANAFGPYPRIGHQYTPFTFGGKADSSFFSLPWVQTMAGPIVPPEDNMQSGQFQSQAYLPFPPGAFKQLALYRDYVSAANTVSMRLAIHSRVNGYSQVMDPVVLTVAVPTIIMFSATDVDAISVSITKGNGPVGYSLS